MPKFRYAKPSPIKWYGYFPAATLRRTYSGGFRFHCRYGPCDCIHQSTDTDMELGHWVTGSMGHLSRPGHRVIIWPAVRPEFFWFSKKIPKMKILHLKCWNDKSHCQVSVVGLKSLDVSQCNELLLLPMIIKILWPENTSSHISRHLEFIIEKGHQVNWVSGSLDSRVTGSLGH